MTVRRVSEVLSSSIVHIRLHIDSSSDSAYYKDHTQDIADSPESVPQLKEVNVAGVADVQAAEQTHKSLIEVLAGRRILPSFETKKQWQDIENEAARERDACFM